MRLSDWQSGQDGGGERMFGLTKYECVIRVCPILNLAMMISSRLDSLLQEDQGWVCFLMVSSPFDCWLLQ